VRLQSFRLATLSLIFEQQTIERFGFDPELLYLARQSRPPPAEIPCAGHSPATKVNMFSDICRCFWTDSSIVNRWMGRYPRSKHA